MEKYVRVYGHELRVGDVVYYSPDTESCAILRVEEVNDIGNTVGMSALNHYATQFFTKSVYNGYHYFWINYSIELYKKQTTLQPIKHIKEFKL